MSKHARLWFLHHVTSACFGWHRTLHLLGAASDKLLISGASGGRVSSELLLSIPLCIGNQYIQVTEDRLCRLDEAESSTDAGQQGNVHNYKK
ncbi:hypothetical protein IWZ01DRAFT_491783 [Phyllosticta capitalensis]